MEAPLIRQSTFTPDGRITTVSAATENPELEEQGDLWTWQETEAKAKAWKEGARAWARGAP